MTLSSEIPCAVCGTRQHEMLTDDKCLRCECDRLQRELIRAQTIILDQVNAWKDEGSRLIARERAVRYMTRHCIADPLEDEVVELAVTCDRLTESVTWLLEKCRLAINLVDEALADPVILEGEEVELESASILRREANRVLVDLFDDVAVELVCKYPELERAGQ